MREHLPHLPLVDSVVSADGYILHHLFLPLLTPFWHLEHIVHEELTERIIVDPGELVLLSLLGVFHPIILSFGLPLVPQINSDVGDKIGEGEDGEVDILGVVELSFRLKGLGRDFLVSSAPQAHPFLNFSLAFLKGFSLGIRHYLFLIGVYLHILNLLIDIVIPERNHLLSTFDVEMLLFGLAFPVAQIGHADPCLVVDSQLPREIEVLGLHLEVKGL